MERLRHNIYPEMSFPALSISGMSDVLVGFAITFRLAGAKALVNFSAMTSRLAMVSA